MLTVFFVLFFFVFVFFFLGLHLGHVDSQAWRPIGAVAASFRESHSKVGSELSLQLTPQLMATPGP